jgi:AcrR family transcriptional regulator
METLIDEGYAGASVQRIATRAGVSQGGLFRHFATREDLMVAVAEDIGRKLLDGSLRAFQRRKSGEDLLLLSLELVRDSCRSRPSQAWFELAIAARTTPVLREALAPMAARYSEQLVTTGRALLPHMADALGEDFTVLMATVFAVFDGEAVHGFIVKDRRLDRARFDMVLALLRSLIASRAPPERR